MLRSLSADDFSQLQEREKIKKKGKKVFRSDDFCPNFKSDLLILPGALTFLDYFFIFFPVTLPNVKSDLLMLPVSEALTFCGWIGPQFTCFTSTKVQILTQKQEKDHLYRLFQALAPREIDERDLLSLLLLY